ncbi:MAG: zinc-finger domain-containing protein [Proteobacteria bacterium]|nr:zinc-finger domain-containing protein [Pseudomonadota bacterium]
MCDGADGFGGHPRVFLDLGKTGQATCPYCGRIFKKEDGHAA